MPSDTEDETYVTTTHHNTPQHMQHTTTHHNTPQHTTTYHNTLQHATRHHNTPQHTTCLADRPVHCFKKVLPELGALRSVDLQKKNTKWPSLFF